MASSGANHPKKWCKTYIQTSHQSQPIKVIPSDVTNNFMKPPDEGFRYYTIVPEAHGQVQIPARPIQCLNGIQEGIKGRLTSYLKRIVTSGCKDDFQIGIEARFGRQYQELQEGAEEVPPLNANEFKEKYLETCKHNFCPRLLHDIRPVLDKYCAQDRKKEIKRVSLDFVLKDPNQEYTAVIEEIKHGEFVLKAVEYKPNRDKIYPAKYDIVLPERKYDIRIAHKSGPTLLSTNESFSYKAAEAMIKSMERKGPDTCKLTLKLAGQIELGDKKSKYRVKSIRHKVQTQYPWKGEGKIVLAKYYVMQHEFKGGEAVNDKCDIHFHPNDCREELELWNEKIFAKDVDQTNPSRGEYLNMQSCVTPLMLEGEDEPVPPRPWQTAEELMEKFDDFFKAVFDVANALELEN